MDIRPITSAAGAASNAADGIAPVAPRPATKEKSNALNVATSQAVEQTSAAPSAEQTKQAVKKINSAISSLSQGVVFSIDESSKSTVVSVVDAQTKEVLRQMPSKEALEIAKALDRVQGMLIKQKV